jgi:serine protease Do
VLLKAISSIVAVLAATGPLVVIAQAQRTATADGRAAAAQIEQTLVEAIARAEPSVVAISRTSPTQKEGRSGDLFRDLRENASNAAAPLIVGAGVIIDRDGFVLTHYRAVREGNQHFVTTTDRATYPATIRAADPRSGLAVLAIDRNAGPVLPAGAPTRPVNAGSFPPLPFGDAATLRKGQFVIAIGNPYAIRSDGQSTASWGTVTNFGRKAPSGTNLNDAAGADGEYRTTLHHLGTLIQTDAKLGFSASGGALVNLQGELVGLTTDAATIAGHEQAAGYAIPMNPAIRRIIDTLKQGREAEYGMMGVSFGQRTAGMASSEGSRLSLLQVFAGSPAARAGLEAGDVVTRVNGRPLDDVDSVQLAISLLPPASVANIEYLRRGQPATAYVKLAKLGVAGKKIVTVRPKAWQGLRVDYATARDGVAYVQAIASGANDPEGCVLVTDVEQGSVAWKAGVREGMFISHVGGKRVATPEEFQAATRAVGEKFDIRLTAPAERDAETHLDKP